MHNIWKYLIVALVLMFSSMQSFSVCAAPVKGENGEYSDPSLPAGLTDGLQYGEYTRFNTPAKVNGLGGTNIWLELTLGGIQINGTGQEAGYYSLGTDTFGNAWFVILDGQVFTSQDVYNKLVGHPVFVAAEYQGFSDAMNAPVVMASKIYDMSTNETIMPMLFQSVRGFHATAESLETIEGMLNQAHKLMKEVREDYKTCLNVGLEVPAIQVMATDIARAKELVFRAQQYSGNFVELKQLSATLSALIDSCYVMDLNQVKKGTLEAVDMLNKLSTAQMTTYAVIRDVKAQKKQMFGK